MREVWVDISGYEGLYQVSNWGQVKSFPRNGTINEIKILKPFKSRNGYLRIKLCKDGVIKTYYVHRLVAEAFIENPNNLPEVNHINEVKTDNRSENLEYCDHKTNINHGSRNERIATSMTNGKRSKAILQFDSQGSLIKEFPSSREVTRQLGYSQGEISKCCNGLRESAYGSIWRFKENETDGWLRSYCFDIE